MNRLPRLAFALAAFALAGLSLARFQAGRSRIEGLRAELLPRLGSDLAAATAAALGREPDVPAAEALVARALLADALRQAAQAGSVPAGGNVLRSPIVDQLERAQELATRALAARPTSWVASLARGGSIYLGRSLARDSRLLTEPAAWEGALARSRRLAPGQVEAQRWLALAYLELWAFLPEAKREQTRELVAIGLADPTTFDRIIRPWLAIAKDHTKAHALMPATPFAWERLSQIYGNERDWTGYAQAREGLLEAIEGTATATVEAAEARLAAGDPRGARALYLGALAALPVDGRFSTLLARILAGLPGGPVDVPSETAMRRWLDWALAGATPGERALPAEAIGRLEGVMADLPPATAALAAVLADDLARAEQIERRRSELGGDAWSRYFLAKAQHRLAHGDRAGAEAALARLPLEEDSRLATVMLRHELASRGTNTLEQQRGSALLLAARRDAWGPADWHMSGHTATLAFLPARAASRLLLEILEGPAEGGAIAVRLDGATIDFLPVEPGQTTLLLTLPLTAKPHHLELQAHANQPVRPGTTRLGG